MMKCYICEEKHGLKCEKFARISRMERFEIVKSQALCFNCLKPGHIADERRKPMCKCGERKHFRIHICKKQYIMSLKTRNSPGVSNIWPAR